MKLSTILIGAGALALGGYVYYDYNSADSKNARELKEIEQLAPDVKAPSCFPQGLNARLFARLQKYRVEADYSTEFVLTREALEEDFAACSMFIERVRGVIASLLP